MWERAHMQNGSELRKEKEMWLWGKLNKAENRWNISRMERICARKMWHVWVCQLEEEMRTLGLDWVRNRCFTCWRMLPGSTPAPPGTSQFLLFWQFTKTDPCIGGLHEYRSWPQENVTKVKKLESLETNANVKVGIEAEMMERTKALRGRSGLDSLCGRPRNGAAFPSRGLLLTYTTFNQGCAANLHHSCFSLQIFVLMVAANYI